MQWIYQPQLHKDKGPFIIYQSGGVGEKMGELKVLATAKGGGGGGGGAGVDYLLLRGCLKILKKQSL